MFGSRKKQRHEVVVRTVGPESRAKPEPSPAMVRLAWVVVGTTALIFGFALLSGGGDSTEAGPVTAPTASASASQKETDREQARAERLAADEAKGEELREAAATSAGNGPAAWARPITDVEYRSGTLRLGYHESGLTEDELHVVARFFFLLEDELDTVVVTDADGRDHNVFRRQVVG